MIVRLLHNVGQSNLIYVLEELKEVSNRDISRQAYVGLARIRKLEKDRNQQIRTEESYDIQYNLIIRFCVDLVHELESILGGFELSQDRI